MLASLINGKYLFESLIISSVLSGEQSFAIINSKSKLVLLNPAARIPQFRFFEKKQLNSLFNGTKL